MHTARTSAFTLIELLVVIAIVGILAALVITRLSNQLTNAKIARSKSDLTGIQGSIETARTASGKTLLEITGNGCSDCSCRTGSRGNSDPLTNLPATDPCLIDWQNDRTAIINTLDADPDFKGDYAIAHIQLDPWNAPYFIDENEGEGGPEDCRNDTLSSAGPGSVYNQWEDGDQANIIIKIPLLNGCPTS